MPGVEEVADGRDSGVEPRSTGDNLTVLGVNCTTDCAYLAVSENGELRDDAVELIPVPALGESPEQLVAVLDELKRVFAEVGAEKVMLLKPESGRMTKRTHSEYTPRIALETLVRLAAAQTSRPVELLPLQWRAPKCPSMALPRATCAASRDAHLRRRPRRSSCAQCLSAPTPARCLSTPRTSSSSARSPRQRRGNERASLRAGRWQSGLSSSSLPATTTSRRRL